jgi:hypothetical protein
LKGGGEVWAEVAAGELRLKIKGRELALSDAEALVNQLCELFE